ncbi:MAG: hypothetical protein FJX72_20520 [Armatimonadetes bacterium]|nr:hypothetical protein [Armatimonadota bacterium]
MTTRRPPDARKPAALPALLVVLGVLLASVAAYWASIRAERQAEAVRPRVESMMVDPEEVLRRNRLDPQLPEPEPSGGRAMTKEEAKAFADAADERHAETARRMQEQMAEYQRVLKQNARVSYGQSAREMRELREKLRQRR